jgi:hypothetical protein
MMKNVDCTPKKIVRISDSTSSLSTSKEDEYVRFNIGSSLNIIDEGVPELRNHLRLLQEQRFFSSSRTEGRYELSYGK